MKRMAVLPDADYLAEFANLTSQDVTAFRLKTTGRDTGPDFAPAGWWDYQPTDSDGNPLPKKQWQFTQELVREAWDNQFQSEVGLFDLARLLLSVFEPPDPFLQGRHRRCFAEPNDLAEEFGFHKAIRYLAGGPDWRIMECKKCRRRFVADHNERERCSEQCSYNYELERHNDWGRKNNWGRREARKKRKAEPKPKRRTQ
jgi:hypothetical protein